MTNNTTPILFGLASLNLVANSIILWTINDLATWPSVTLAVAGGLMIVGLWLAVRAARMWDFTRQ